MTTHLQNCGMLEMVATMANHFSTEPTQLHNLHSDAVSQVEHVAI